MFPVMLAGLEEVLDLSFSSIPIHYTLPQQPSRFGESDNGQRCVMKY